MAQNEVEMLVDDFAKLVKSKLSKSLADMVSTEFTEGRATVSVPYWFAVTERGRGPRRNSEDYQLYLKIFSWMERRNLFRSKSKRGRINEAKALTWFINKHGTKQFRDGRFVDIYTSATQVVAQRVRTTLMEQVKKITSDFVSGF